MSEATAKSVLFSGKRIRGGVLIKRVERRPEGKKRAAMRMLMPVQGEVTIF
jgi:hypothetical protein